MKEQENELLRRAAAHLARDINFGHGAYRRRCSRGGYFTVLGRSKQGYSRRKTNPVTERDWIDAQVVSAALDIYDDDPTFRPFGPFEGSTYNLK